MRRNTLVMVMLAVVALPAIAEEKKAGKGKAKEGGRNVAAQILKQLADVDLTEEQTEKIKAAGKAASAEMAKIRDEAGITGELMKKRAAAAKSLADSDKKGKQRNEAINEAAGLTKPQAEAMDKMNAVRAKFTQAVLATLTDAQKEKLPKQLQRAARPDKGKKPNKKKDAA
ncbi:hypothetical protein Poly24_46740 [Rosistilla carotiformis]|uniref:LTXXQ motif protein n=1 Tax=Rosistilla carotiformis TaxID=2528017 RepID=A0A518JZG9_9BACT|nr:hypothetical protein [Rosistilla carotiformis]QDV70941.1 hypothetical protein Poly24_46740 [Rosistilla carotiformis]